LIKRGALHQKKSGLIYRGICVIREELDSLTDADQIEQIREFNSWTTSKGQAEFFAQLAQDNLEIDDTVKVVFCAKIAENTNCLFIDAFDNELYSLNDELAEFSTEEEVLQVGKRIKIFDVFIL
jgi:hypothetical protein